MLSGVWKEKYWRKSASAGFTGTPLYDDELLFY